MKPKAVRISLAWDLEDSRLVGPLYLALVTEVKFFPVQKKYKIKNNLSTKDLMDLWLLEVNCTHVQTKALGPQTLK